MLLADCRNGCIEYEKALPEALTSTHWARTDVIITYLAKGIRKLKD